MKGLAEIVEGIVTLSFDKIKKGFSTITNGYVATFKEGLNDVKSFGKDAIKNGIDAINEVIKNKKVNHIEVPAYIVGDTEITGTDETDRNGKGNTGKNKKKKKNGKKDKNKVSAEEMAKKEAEAIRKAEDLLTQLVEQTEEERRKQIETAYNRQIEDIKRRLETEKGLTVNAKKALSAQIVLLERVKQKKLSEFDDTAR